MQNYAHVATAPLDIGGRPKFSWPSLAPIAFVVGVAFCAIGGAAIAARHFKLGERVDGFRTKREAMRGDWSVLARTDDAQRRAESRAILKSLDAKNIEEVAS